MRVGKKNCMQRLASCRFLGYRPKFSNRVKNQVRTVRMESDNESMPFHAIDVAERPNENARDRFKRKVAMLVGYVGKNYHGFQKCSTREVEEKYPCNWNYFFYSIFHSFF